MNTMRVASVPASHVYIRHLSSPDPELDPVRRLSDPPPSRQDAPTGAPWWPPAMLDPAWIAAHDFDLMHLHFGFDAQTPAQLSSVVDALDAKGVPLVYTVHDLWNPHHEDSALHESQLEVLINRAKAVITLSEQAATEIETRWGVRPEVIPHPHVVDFERMDAGARAPRRAAEEFRLGIHLKSLRANMAGIPLLQAAAEAVAEIPGGVLQVNVHRDVFEDTGARHDAELARWLRGREGAALDLRVHDYFSDAELFDYLSSLHASLLPYRFGTHSGWMEAAHDLGTAVIAPDVGCYRSQGADHLYHWHGEGRLDVPSLQRAIRTAAERPDPTAAQQPARTAAEESTVAWRRRQRHEIAAAHAQVYRRALSAVTAGLSGT
ncbi:glycosyltransferase [Nesterenkonia lutea]|uniref:Glycosyltransferase involved in cell wall biosynthesis n=1 Tax=Nesterenkonia lutea TaxID=272919 RepID=A0ABR9JFA4_9MICC|nr:glycosyltransferase [Nesterenkonia lutea]MBE1524611.1 glycosyltransferase involved in cell wall biosynthesis [Nesterenkonia lutea]